MKTDILQIHKNCLDFLLDWQAEHDDFYFVPRKIGSMSILWAQKVELFSQHNICRENYFLGC